MHNKLNLAKRIYRCCRRRGACFRYKRRECVSSNHISVLVRRRGPVCKQTKKMFSSILTQKHFDGLLPRTGISSSLESSRGAFLTAATQNNTKSSSIKRNFIITAYHSKCQCLTDSSEGFTNERLWRD